MLHERKIEYAIDEINDYREVYTSQIHGIVNNNSQFEQCMNEYMTFIKNQMIRDGKAINFTLKEYDKTKVLNSKNNSFSQPSGYNENNERIIAMTAYYLYYGRFNGSLSMHYYLRNGNGTCPTHGGNCSIWSQKKVFELKKIFSYLTAGIFTISLLLINISYAVQGSENLWAKFLKYDLCITDYNSLSDEEKELCKFIFDTEQTSGDRVQCERARRILAHDKNIGERITLEQLEGAYGIWEDAQLQLLKPELFQMLH